MNRTARRQRSLVFCLYVCQLKLGSMRWRRWYRLRT